MDNGIASMKDQKLRYMARASLYLHQRRARSAHTNQSFACIDTVKDITWKRVYSVWEQSVYGIWRKLYSGTTMMCSMAKNFFCHFIHQLAPDRTMFRSEFHLLDAHFRKVKHYSIPWLHSIFRKEIASKKRDWEKEHIKCFDIEKQEAEEDAANIECLLASMLNVVWWWEFVQFRCVSEVTK